MAKYLDIAQEREANAEPGSMDAYLAKSRRFSAGGAATWKPWRHPSGGILFCSAPEPEPEPERERTPMGRVAGIRGFFRR